jgi:uncharacterized protein (TIGR02328 family)
MRLWHQALIPYLPRQQLLGQYRECCALRGEGWGKKHSVVDYIFTHNPAKLVAYHYIIMEEMERRGYLPARIWDNPDWRGNALGEQVDWADRKEVDQLWMNINQIGQIIYPEHNETYLNECLDNLKSKGIEINF